MDRTCPRVTRNECGFRKWRTRCGHVGEGAALHVSVRAMILSLARFRIASPEQTAALEKGWAGYRSRNGLDLFGKRPAAESDGFAECATDESPPQSVGDHVLH